MRMAGCRWLRIGAVVLLVAGAIAGCENPLDPINKSDKIQGLAYVDFSSTWDRWDSDPEYDGVSITMNYFNEFGNSLSFHDKPHKIVIEFWTSRDTTKETTATTTGLIGRNGFVTAKLRSAVTSPFSTAGLIIQDKLWYSKTVEYSNSADQIRIPIEAYSSLLPPCPVETTTTTPTTTTTTTTGTTGTTGTTATTTTPPAPTSCEAKGFMVLRVFPPQEFPRPELVVAQQDIIFFKPVVAQSTPNP